jgi:hypothetical protein
MVAGVRLPVSSPFAATVADADCFAETLRLGALSSRGAAATYRARLAS